MMRAGGLATPLVKETNDQAVVRPVSATERPDDGIDLSIVVPVLDEEENIEELVRQIRHALPELRVEIIFIDDGSRDGTRDAIRRLKQDDPLIRLAALKRHWGKSPAMAVGFDLARGPVIVTMDGDLQDDPAEIPKFLQAIEEGNDLVCGWRVDRKDSLDKRLPSKIFNRLAVASLEHPLHDFNCGFKAYSAPLARSINLYGDMHRYVPILASMQGARITEVPVKHRPRMHGRSKYGAGRLIRGVLDLLTVSFLTKFLDRPLHFFGRIGGLIGGLGVLIGAYLVGLKFLTGAGIGDRPLLLLAVLMMLIGLQFVTLGLFGEVLGYRMRSRRQVDVMADIE